MAQGIWTPGGGFDQQPQGPVEVDWANPIARGLRSAIVDSGALKANAVSKANLSRSAPAYVQSKPVRNYYSAEYAFGAYDSEPIGIVGLTEFTALSLYVKTNSLGDTPYGGPFGASLTGETTRSFEVEPGGPSSTYFSVWGDNGARYNLLADGALNPLNVPRTIAMRLSASVLSGYFDGVKAGTAAGPATLQTVHNIHVGANPNGWGGVVPVFYFWTRALSDAEIASISANPWQLFRDDDAPFVFDMGAGSTSSVQSDSAATYAIREAVAADATAAYGIREAVVADASASYNILANVQADATASFVIRTPVAIDAEAAYSLRTAVASDSGAVYDVLEANAVVSDSTAAYQIREAVAADSIAAFAIRSSVASDAGAAYDIRTAVTSDQAAAYSILSEAYADGVSTYNIRAAVYADAAALYSVLADVAPLTDAEMRDMYEKVQSIFALGPGPSSTDIAAAVLAALNATAIPVDTVKMNGAQVYGTGQTGDAWRGEGVSP